MRDTHTKAKKGNLLLIDDDPAVLQVLGAILAKEGYGLTSVTQGRMGLKAARDELPDLVLLDIGLSDLDGIEVCRRLKADKRTSAIPVVFISGLKAVEDKIRGFEAGGVDYIAKPFGVQEVLARVAAHLTISRSRKQIEAQNVRLEQEIRDRKMAEMERQRLIAAIEHAAEGIFLAGPDRVITYANRSLCAETGYSKEEIVGRPMDSLAGEGNERSFYTGVRNAMKAGVTWSGRYSTRKKDGTSYQVEGSVVPIKDDSGLVTNYVCVTRDITEQLRLQEELQQAQKMEAMGTLAGGIAHDFNNILGAILGNAELAMEDVPIDSPTYSNLQGVVKAGMRGRDLVRQILAFTKKTRTEKRPVSLAPLIRETHALLRASIPATVEVALAVDAAWDTVEADPVQIQQVLLNLVTNAVDALTDQVGRVEIRLSNVTFNPGDAVPDKGVRPGDYVVLTVADTGCGMTEEVKRRIFEPFFSTKKPGRGTGMGLAVVYGIVKDLGGAIAVLSTSGAGSIFAVYFPRAKVLSKPRRERKNVSMQGRRERILFVDDEEPIVLVGMNMLGRLGFDVTIARGGADALEQFARDPNLFDVVITDQTMPGMTGLALTEELKRIRPAVPIVLCSGRTDLLPPQQMKRLGVAACVTKPFTRSELARAVLAALGREERAESPVSPPP
jgi:PAS domain S-box-containing protein